MIIKSIDQLLAGRRAVTISSTASVKEACTLLDQRNASAVAVVDDGVLVGILSERDVLHRCYGRGLEAVRTRVDTVMTRDPLTAHRSDSLGEAAARMIERGVGHLPVIDNVGHVIGVLAWRDIPTEYRLMVERYNSFHADAAVA